MGVWWTSVFYATRAKMRNPLFHARERMDDHFRPLLEASSNDAVKMGSYRSSKDWITIVFFNDGQLSLWLRFDNLYINYGQFLLWLRDVQGQWLFGNEFYRWTMTRNNNIAHTNQENYNSQPGVWPCTPRDIWLLHVTISIGSLAISQESAPNQLIMLRIYDDTLHFFESLKHLHVTLQEEHPQIARWLSRWQMGVSINYVPNWSASIGLPLATNHSF